MIVIVRTPRQDAADVQMLSQDLTHHILVLIALGGVHVMRSADGGHVMIAGIPAEVGGVDPSLELKGKLTRVDGELPGARQVLWSAGVLKSEVPSRQVNRLAIGAIDLRLEEKVGREPFG